MCKKRNGSLGKKRSSDSDSDSDETFASAEQKGSAEIPEHLYNPDVEEPKKDDKTESSEYYLAGKMI